MGLPAYTVEPADPTIFHGSDREATCGLRERSFDQRAGSCSAGYGSVESSMCTRGAKRLGDLLRASMLMMGYAQIAVAWNWHRQDMVC